MRFPPPPTTPSMLLPRRSHFTPLALVLLLLIAAIAAGGSPTTPEGRRSLPTLQALTVEPAKIRLHGANRQQQRLVTGRTTDGRLIDVTPFCETISSDPAIASVSGATVRGRHDGLAGVSVRLGHLSKEASVRVADFAHYPPVHFANDVVPLFSKLGCNNGGCHGKASGQNDFKLSVFGFDPRADYDALVKEARDRRLVSAAPERSLLLMKPTGQMSHGGGRRIEVGAPEYELLHEWVRQGMPFGSSDAPHVVSLRVSPVERLLGFGAEQQVLATAVFSDGSLRDVTAAAGYTSNAGHVAEVDRAGRVRTGQAPGEAAITVSYVGQVAAVRIRVPRPRAPDPYPALPVNNKIDELALAKRKAMGLLPSDLCDDATFLRRVYLDLLGTLPTPDEVRTILADKDAARRKRVIDQFLDRPEHEDYWALRWSDVLLVNRDRLGDRGAFELHRWLREQFARNRPYHRWVRCRARRKCELPGNYSPKSRASRRRRIKSGRRPRIGPSRAATILHALGIDPATTLHTSLGRPVELAGGGTAVTELF
jgi:Protein of unknown function (DUF1549)/Bacterial Ig-like domain (group 2)